MSTKNTIDGLEMTRMLPTFNVWHDLDVGKATGMAIDAKSASVMIDALNEMFMPSALLEDSLSAALAGGAPFSGAKSASIDEYNKRIVQIAKTDPGNGGGVKAYERAAGSCVAPVPPIKVCFRRDTSWQNASFRTGSSCWWSSQFKTNWTPGEGGWRTGFAILFAMDRSRVKPGALGNWEDARARGGKDMYPEGWGPLGRAWVYPAPGGFYVFNTYDDFRSTRSVFSDQIVASMIAGILNKAVGKEQFTGGWRQGSTTPFSIVHMNNNRCGEVWAIDGERPFTLARDNRIATWESVYWWTVGDNRRGITTAPMIYSFKYTSKQLAHMADMFMPLFQGKEYIVADESIGQKVRLIDPAIKTVRGKMFGTNIMPAAAFRLDEKGNVDTSVAPLAALDGTGRLGTAVARFLDKIKKIPGLQFPINRSAEKSYAEAIFSRRLPDHQFFGAVNDIVCGATPSPTPESVESRLDLFCMICQEVYKTVDEELAAHSEELAAIAEAKKKQEAAAKALEAAEKRAAARMAKGVKGATAKKSGTKKAAKKPAA